VPVLTFDVIDPEYTSELIMDFDTDNHQAYNEGLAVLKYESSNLILNIGGLFWFMVIRAIIIAMIYLSYFLKRFFAYCLRNHKDIDNTIFDRIHKFCH